MAAQHYSLRREVATAYSATDPRNADWRRDVAAAESTYAGVLRLLGSFREAEQAYERAIAILRPIAEATPALAIRQRDLADAELGLGWAYFERGDVDAAAGRADTVEQLLAPLLSRGSDREATRRAAEGRLLAADVAARRGNTAQAKQLRESALALVVSGQEANPEKRLLAVQARALLALNRKTEAGPIVDRLTSLGYRHPALIRLAQQNGLKFTVKG
jgi:tetratricopeptide (TPR) repeat protein